MAINESKVKKFNHPSSMNQYINLYIFGYIGYAHPKQGGSKVGEKRILGHMASYQ
jgi:hypothetical protein